MGLDVFIKYLIHHLLNSLEIMKERQRWGLFSLKEGSRQRGESCCCPLLLLWGSREDGAFLGEAECRDKGQKGQAAATEILI